MWRRSVSRRSPSTSPSTRPGSRSTSVIVSDSDASPRRRSTAAQACRRRWTSSHSSSSADATRSAVQPRNDVIVAARARAGDAGRSSASSSRSHSRAAGVANTLPAPLMTAGMSQPVERVADQQRLLVGADQHGDLARPGAGAQQRDQVLGDVARHVLARRVDLRVALLGQFEFGAVHDPHPQRRADAARRVRSTADRTRR